MTTFDVLAVMTLPFATVLSVLLLSAWRQRRWEATVIRQVAVSDAIDAELGAVVTPVVRKRLAGPWEVRIALAPERLPLATRIVSIAHRVFAGLGQSGRRDYEIVLTTPGAPRRVQRAGRRAVGWEEATWWARR